MMTQSVDPAALSQQLSTEVRVLMTRRNLNQQELADAVGHDTNWLGRRLSGRAKYSIDDLVEICDALDVDLHNLVGNALVALKNSASR